MDFSGKVAIVTGSAGGIGEGIARVLAEAGAHIVIADINEQLGKAVAEAINGEGGKAIFAPVDISSEASTQALAATTAEKFGKIDYLVNNAALFGGMQMAGLLDMDLAYYNRFMSINLHGPLLPTRAVVPYMEKAGGGAIVNTSSTAAYMGYGPYSLAKLGVNGLTFGLARELGPRGIRINAIAPGPTDTAALRNEVVTEDYIKGMISTMPISRLGTPLDHGQAVKFLLSDDASWITGHVLNVDGGQWMRV